MTDTLNRDTAPVAKLSDEEILALVPEHFPATRDGEYFDIDGVISLYAFRFVEFARAVEALAADPDEDSNAPWLSLAHSICADAGIPPGHITTRLEQLRAAIAASQADQPQPVVPEGWRLVPTEPTDAMLDAADDASVLSYTTGTPSLAVVHTNVYAAMLAAAPSAPAQQAQHEHDFAYCGGGHHQCKKCGVFEQDARHALNEQSEHSALPWRITEPNERKGREIVCARGSTIAKLTALDMQNAELIVASVNRLASLAATPPAQEPVAWAHKIDLECRDDRDYFNVRYETTPGFCIPLYAAPAAQQVAPTEPSAWQTLAMQYRDCLETIVRNDERNNERDGNTINATLALRMPLPDAAQQVSPEADRKEQGQ